MEEHHNVQYFRNLWRENVNDLQTQCEVWEKICINNTVPEEVLGDIRTNIGLAKLLMNQKLKQFNGLIDDSEFNTGEKEITCLDLQGFWDMVYNEVEKINNCFNKLEKCKNNEWKFVDEKPEKLLKKKVIVKKEVTLPKKNDDSSTSRALAAKQRLAEAKKKMLALREQQQNKSVQLTAIETLNIQTAKKVDENSKQDQPYVNRERRSSDKNKENIMLDNVEVSPKYNLKKEAKSKESGEKVSIKKRSKKDYGTLQCVTRSAKKALLTQQNSNVKS